MAWQDFRDDIEAHFNPRRAVPDFERYFALYREMTAATDARLRSERDIRYGEGKLQTLDYFPGGQTGKPLVVYIHGGYWRGLDKSMLSFVAEPFVAAGLSAVSLNYDLCPNVTLDKLLAEIAEAIVFLGKAGRRFNGDGRLFLTGDSAGAHLCAAMLAIDWSKHGLPADIVAGAALFTGIYEIEPVLHVSVNQEIRLSADLVAPCSPMRHPPLHGLPLLLAVGAAEPAGWIEQTLDYAKVCRKAGCAVDLVQAANENHFSMTLLRADAAHPLAKAAVTLASGL